MKQRFIFFNLIVLGALTTTLGCAAPLTRWCCEKPCAQPCEGTPAIVNVGGHVHEPKQLEIGSNGLTLRNALLAAGGSREPAQVQETTSNPAAVSALQDLVTAARLAGGTFALQEVYAEFPTEASNFIPTSKEQLRNEFIQQEKDVAALIEELSTTFEKRDLQLLSTYSRDVGNLRALLELLNLSAFRERVKELEGWQDEELNILLRESTENEANVSEELLDRRGKTSLRSLQTELLVSLERSAMELPVSYYVPYDLVVAGMAGEIALQAGDVVSVVDVRETNLIPPDVAGWSGASTVALQGYIEASGTALEVATIGNIHSLSRPTINDPRSVWMLVRPAPTGQAQQVFILPDQMVAANGAAAAAPTQEGDVYTYTILPQVPIVFETLLARAVEAEKCKCVRELQEMRARRQLRSQTRFDRFCGFLSKTKDCAP